MSFWNCFFIAVLDKMSCVWENEIGFKLGYVILHVAWKTRITSIIVNQLSEDFLH